MTTLSTSNRAGRRATVDRLATYAPIAQVASLDAQLLLDCSAEWQKVLPNTIESFKWWMVDAGFAIATVNNRLTHIRSMATEAFENGHLNRDAMRAIVNIESVSRGIAQNIENLRKAKGEKRVGRKKLKYTTLTDAQCVELKRLHDATPQGYRDRVLMCLLLDHGLWVSEIASLMAEQYDVKTGAIRPIRNATGAEQTIALSVDSLAALIDYRNAGGVMPGQKLLRSSRRGGRLALGGMTIRACAGRINEIGRYIGILHLSSGDCRNYFALKMGSSTHGTEQQRNALGLATGEMLLDKLRKENRDLRAEVVALRKALRSKEYVVPKMAGAMDWSSTDIEK